jgi:hypothetical protein
MITSHRSGTGRTRSRRRLVSVAAAGAAVALTTALTMTPALAAAFTGPSMTVNSSNNANIAGPAHAAAASGTGVPVTPIALTSDWSGHAGLGSGSPGFYVDTAPGPQVVHLQGAVRQVSTKGGAAADIIGVLPPAARPFERSVFEKVDTGGGTYAEIEIDQFGDIAVFPPHSPAVTDFSFVSLEGVSFERLPSNVNFPVTVNTDNWSGNTEFLDAVAPSVYTDGSGIVHLQGAVTQTSAQGAGADVIGTLVPAFRPNFNVFTIAPTFQGGYADLFISAETGQIILIGARSPAVDDNHFVSLDGITYTQDSGDVPIAVNTANFAGSTAFGTPRPAVEVEASGVVNLDGAVARTSGAGRHANLVGTIPEPGARPHRDVYLITHTFDGTYADLVITPAGRIDLIDPRPPMVTGTSFVSLAGLSYQP